MKTPDVLCLFIGDIHAGHQSALSTPAHHATPDNELLYTHWQAMIARVKVEAKGRPLILLIGGDATEGAHHGLSGLWTTSVKEMRDDAIALLLPLANMAHMIYGLRGTSVHAGPNGDDD